MMPHDADMAAVLAEALQARFPELRWKDRRFAVEDILAALTAAGYAVVKLPTIEDCEDPYVCCLHERPTE